MFDNKIPTYWDYERDPDNYFEFSNGVTKHDLNNYTLDALNARYEDLTSPTYINLGKQSPFSSINDNTSEFRSWKVNKEPFIYPIKIQPFLAHGARTDQPNINDKAYKFWNNCITIHDEVLDLVCNQKRGKICLYNNWEAWEATVYINIMNVLCSRYAVWGLNFNHFIISSCNELLSSDERIPHHVKSSLLCLEPFSSTIQDTIIDKIRKKEQRKNKFICLNRVQRWHRHAAVAELWDDTQHGIISSMCVHYGTPGIDEFQSIAGLNHTGQQWIDYVRNNIKNNRTMRWYVKEGLQDNYPQSYSLYEKHNLIDKIPIMLEDDGSPIINPVPDPNTQKFFDSSLNIVTETFGGIEDGSIFLTEKVYKPMLHFQPFVIVAGPNHILSLKNRGYKTFDNWIDESYDSIQDNQTRLTAAIQSAKQFYMRSKEDIAQDLFDMLDTLIHNRNHYEFDKDHLRTSLLSQVAMTLNYCRRDE